MTGTFKSSERSRAQTLGEQLLSHRDTSIDFPCHLYLGKGILGCRWDYRLLMTEPANGYYIAALKAGNILPMPSMQVKR